MNLVLLSNTGPSLVVYPQGGRLRASGHSALLTIA